MTTSLQLLSENTSFHNLHTLSIEHRLNALPHATVLLRFDSRRQLEEDSRHLLPGQNIAIHADDQILFSGSISKYQVQYTPTDCLLTLNCQHFLATPLTTLPRSRYFTEHADDVIIREIFAAYPIDVDIRSSLLWSEQVIQQQTSDWDFLLQRLHANGLVVYCTDHSLIIDAPALNPEHSFVLSGDALTHLDVAIDTHQHMTSLQLYAWDSANQELMQAEANDIDFAVNDQLSAAALLPEKEHYRHTVYLAGNYSQTELNSLANAQLTCAQLSLVQGTVTARGLHPAVPGQTLQLTQCGDQLSGHYYLTGICYEYTAESALLTHCHIGLPKQDTRQITQSVSTHLLIGTVLDTQMDPGGEFRIKVSCAAIDPENNGIWARLATAQASKDAGLLFRPAIGSEIVLGLLSDNPRDVVILGACHSSAKPPPWDNANQHGYQSANQLQLIFDDNTQQIQLNAGHGTRLRLSQTDNTVVLEDAYQNKLLFDRSGITLKSPRIRLESDALSLEAKQDLKIASDGTVTIRGSLVNIN